MIAQIAILLVSLTFLVISADKFVELVQKFAISLGISAMVVGLTIVAIGTSLPELASSVAGALDGITGIAVGNVFGSNICNIGLIMGVPAIFHPIRSHRSQVLSQGVQMLAVTFLVSAVMFSFSGIPSSIGYLMLLCFAFYIFLAYRSSGDNDAEEEVKQFEKLDYVLLVASFVVLVFCSKSLVSSTTFIARAGGVPEELIAFTLIALGTSLPELSVSLAAARRRQGDILIGNVIGSNISNLLLVLGATAVIEPIKITYAEVIYDIPIVIAFSLAMIFMLLRPLGINKSRGIFLLTAYVFSMALVSYAKSATV